MKRPRIIRNLIPLVLIPAVFLQGCHLFYEPEFVPPETASPTEDEYLPPEILPAPSRPRPGRFTLRYDSNSSLNPITTLNRDNILLASLMYESLFVLDGELNVEPVLCESWESDDFTTFTFNIKPNIAMNDGGWLTADDVMYSIRQATQRGRYVNRLKSIASISTDGGLSVTIMLYDTNSRFPSLLDIPIIKAGSIEDRIPPGTGPYIFTGESNMYMERFVRHRDFFDLPVTTVYLIEFADDELTQAFDDGEISLLWDDPSDSFEIRLNRLFDPRYYETTTMQFIGFNGRSRIIRDPYVRRAIGCAVERDYIVSEIMPPGSAVAAPTPLSRSFQYYDPSWEHSDYDPFEEMALLLEQADFDDYDDDSFLEVWDGYDGYDEVSLLFIVNSENLHRVRAAQRITYTMRRCGLDVTLRELSWDSFISALESGNFDIYYGEIMLGADFDLSPLLLPGNLNYGITASTTYKPFLDDFLIAKTSYEMAYAAGRLLEEIKRNAPFVPVLYKRYVLYSPMGAITGAYPGQSNIFRNIKEWTINLTLLT